MTIRTLALEATEKVSTAISASLSDSEREAVTKAIEGVIVEAVRRTMVECQHAATRCADEDQLKKRIVIEINKSATAQFPDMGSTR